MTEPTSHCPDCGAPLPDDSPQALCPTCLMRQALASRTIVGDEKAMPVSPPLSPEEIADKFPGFEILGCLGRGGMGVVYKARQKSLGRLVAIKILPPERVGEARFADRFAIEAATLAKLSHPNIVTVHDFGEIGGLFYIVMEYVDGVNLRDLLREGKLEPKQALAIVPPICDALQFAHDKGIVHRDIKPENLLLDKDGRVKIADFGIASLMGAAGEIAGTPPYMAPEQKGANIDHRADIYALGVVLYEMLTGERPEKNLIAPSRKVHIDVRLDEMVLRALEKEPERRYQTASEFRTVVESVVDTSKAPAENVASPLLKSGESLYATPGFLSTVWGAMKIHEGMGALLLYQNRLELQVGLNRTVIPLRSIRRLELISYPLLQSPAGLRSIEVEFEDGGTQRRLLLTPSRGMFSFVGTTNRLVFEWFGAIREAFAAHVGRPPEGSSSPVPYRGFSSDGRFVSGFAMLAAFTGALGFLAAVVMTGSWRSVLPVAIPFIFGITFVIAIAWRQRLQWKKEHPLPGGSESQPKPDRSWRWLAVIVIAAAAIPLVAKWVVTPANRSAVSPAVSLLRVTVRVLDVPEDFDDSRLLRPGGLMDSGEVKVLAAPYVELPSGAEGRIQVPEVPLLAHGGSHVLSGRTKMLYVRPALEPGTAHVRYTLEGEVIGTGADRNSHSRQAIRSDSLQLGEWQIMESRSESGRRQLAVISVEMAGAESAVRPTVKADQTAVAPKSASVVSPAVLAELARMREEAVKDFESRPSESLAGDSEFQRRIQERAKRAEELLRGTVAEPLIKEQHRIVREIAAAKEAGNEVLRKQLESEADRVNARLDKLLPLPGSSQRSGANTGNAGDQTRQSIETINAINDTNRFLDLELAVIDAKAYGLGDKHPTVSLAAEVLARFKETHPEVPDAVWRQLVAQRLDKAKEDLLVLTKNGLGHAHPEVVKQQSRVRALEGLMEKPEMAAAPAFTLRWVAKAGDTDVVELTDATKGKVTYADGRVEVETLKVDRNWLLEPSVIDSVMWGRWKGEDKELFITLKNERDMLALSDATRGRLGDEMAVVWNESVVGRFKVEKPLSNGLKIPLIMEDKRAGELERELKALKDRQQILNEKVLIEDLALRMIVAIRERDDAKLKSMAADRIKGWPESLPAFAVELREHYRQIMGDEKFEMKAGESLVDADLGAVRCTGPAALEGKCIVMLFVKTDAGWKNQLLRAAKENIALTELLADFRKQMEKSMPAEKLPGN